jgi:hypothetical protein
VLNRRSKKRAFPNSDAAESSAKRFDGSRGRFPALPIHIDRMTSTSRGDHSAERMPVKPTSAIVNAAATSVDAK